MDYVTEHKIDTYFRKATPRIAGNWRRIQKIPRESVYRYVFKALFLQQSLQNIKLPMTIDFMQVSSYGSGTESCG